MTSMYKRHFKISRLEKSFRRLFKWNLTIFLVFCDQLRINGSRKFCDCDYCAGFFENLFRTQTTFALKKKVSNTRFKKKIFFYIFTLYFFDFFFISFNNIPKCGAVF